MATLTDQVAKFDSDFMKQATEPIKKVVNDAKDQAMSDFNPDKAIQVGAKLPSFKLKNQSGEEVTDASLAAKGAYLLVFYRGGWCPFCNLTLRAYQQRKDDFAAKGVQLVGVSPELPDSSLTTAQKNELVFPVLSDANLDFSRQLGLSWKQPDSLRPLYEQRDYQLAKRNGNDSFELPIPSYILVDKSGVVRNTFFDPDWSRRLEPDVALGWADKL